MITILRDIDRCRFVLKKPESLPGMTKLCLKIMNYTPEDAVKTIVQRLSTVQHDSPERQVEDLKSVRDVYIAAPPSEKSFVAKMAKILWKRKVWSGMHKILNARHYHISIL